MKLHAVKTTKQVAQMLGFSTRNVTYLVQAQKLTPILILENGSFLFDSEDVYSYQLNQTKA